MNTVGVLAELNEHRYRPLPKIDPRIERLSAERAKLAGYLWDILTGPNVLNDITYCRRITEDMRRMESGR